LNRDPVGIKKEPLQGFVKKEGCFGVSTADQKEGWTGGQCIQGD